MGFFRTGIQHFYQDVMVLLELDAQFLVGFHFHITFIIDTNNLSKLNSEKIKQSSIVEEQICLTCQFNFYCSNSFILFTCLYKNQLTILAINYFCQYFSPYAFQGPHFLRLFGNILKSQLQWDFSIVYNLKSVRYLGILEKISRVLPRLGSISSNLVRSYQVINSEPLLIYDSFISKVSLNSNI